MNENRKAIEQVLALCAMVDAGQGDTDQADLLRDELDEHYKDNQKLIDVLNGMAGLLNDDRDTRKAIAPDVELVSGTVRVPVEFTVEQYLYLQTLADDLRGGISEAVQVYVKEGMEANKNGGAKYKVVKAFEHVLAIYDWSTVAPALLEKLTLLFKKKELEKRLQEHK